MEFKEKNMFKNERIILFIEPHTKTVVCFCFFSGLLE